LPNRLDKERLPDKTPWDSSCQEALEKLKEALVNAVSLYSVDFSRDFGILVDASINTVGCCLIQLHEGREYPVAFASAKLSETQSRWSTTEREAYAVVWALKKFRAWLLFSKVFVYSDHNPFKYLTESVPKSSKLTRWALALQDFNLCFNYRPAEQHQAVQAADYLSRVYRPVRATIMCRVVFCFVFLLLLLLIVFFFCFLYYFVLVLRRAALPVRNLPVYRPIVRKA
jgi:RNase H-like domain found in reverse transcriptase